MQIYCFCQSVNVYFKIRHYQCMFNDIKWMLSRATQFCASPICTSIIVFIFLKTDAPVIDPFGTKSYLLLCSIVSLMCNEYVKSFLLLYFQEYVSDSHERSGVFNIPYENDRSTMQWASMLLSAENVCFCQKK